MNNVVIKPMITDDLSATYDDFVSYDNSLVTGINSGIKMDLLWTNADLYSNFIAQTLNIDVKNYKFIIVVVAPKKGNLENFLTYVFVTSIKDNRINVNYYSGTDTDSRGFIIEDDYLKIGDASTDGNINNSVLIPYQIYGVR